MSQFNKIERVFTTTKGRISRKTFWLLFAPLLFIFLITDSLIAPNDKKYALLIALLVLIPAIILYIKRAHDRNKTGWFILLMLVPIVSFWPLIELWFIKGTNRPNNYGNPDDMWST